MREFVAQCEQVIDCVPPGFEAQALLRVTRKGLTRFANSFIHQNVAEDSAVMTVDVAAGGRVARATTSQFDPGSISRLVASVIEAVRLSPIDNLWTGFAAPAVIPDVGHHDPATAAAGPDKRAAIVADFIHAGRGLSGAGFCDTTEEIVAVANHRGLRYEGRATSAVLDGIHQTRSSAGKAHRASKSLVDLDGTRVGEEAAGLARSSENALDIDPGHYEVVLRPNCVATIGIFLGGYAFGGKAAAERMTRAVPGAQQFDPLITLRDDVTHPAALGLPIDWEGTPRVPVDLVVAGESRQFVHDRKTAARMGVTSTGHDWEHSAWFGPAPTNLFVAGGEQSEPEMVESIERGLLVTEFNYCRILDPTALIVTGLTRNGTFLIENGEVTRPVSNLRFTESFFDVLAPGNVLGVGTDARLADCEYGPRMVHAPTMHLGAFRFTGGAAG